MKFDKPPVVETVLSVQFSPLANFGGGQLGAFWSQLGDDWPSVADAPAVDPVVEQFGSQVIWEPAAFGFRLMQKPDIRLQIRNAAQDRMIQIQNGRFFYNWLGKEGVEYPSYDTVRPEFDDQWEKFRVFLSRANEDAIRANQWEVIYVNHIPRGTVWHDVLDLPKVFTFLRQPSLDALNLKADRVGGEWRYEIVPQKGRLYVRLAMTSREETPCLVLTLTARGPIADGFPSLDEGLNVGHQVITDAFSRLTSSDAHKYWGVRNANC